MCDFERRWEFRTKHMPIFVLSIFLGILSYSVVLMLVLDSYFYHEDLSWQIKFYIISGGVVSVFQIVSGVMILHGYPRWVLGMVILYFLCLVVSLPAIFFQESFAFYSLAVCLPLVGLYCLNTPRFRLMLTAATELRPNRKAPPYQRVKTSKRETAINNRRRDLEIKSFAEKMRARHKVTYPIGASLVILFIGAMGYLIYDGFASGYILLGGRGHPFTRYTLSEQPGGFWFGITMYIICIVLSVASLRLMHLMYKMQARG